MIDDLTYTGPRDPTRVNMHDPIEAAWRCGEWGCTFTQLKAAIVGANSVMAEQVETWLKREARSEAQGQ
jgi:Protein of unknown function (DUF3606)